MIFLKQQCLLLLKLNWQLKTMNCQETVTSMLMLSYLPLMGSLVCEQSYNFFSWPNPIQIKYLSIQKIYFLLDMSSDAPNNFVRKRAVLIRRGISIKLCKVILICFPYVDGECSYGYGNPSLQL